MFTSPNFVIVSGNTLSHGRLKALPTSKTEYNTYYLYSTEGEGPHAPSTRGDGSSSARRRRWSDRRNRKAIAEALTKLLLEPCSPSDSDEDGEAVRYGGDRERERERERGG